MLKKEIQIKYLRRRGKTLASQLDAYHASGESSKLHEIRLQLKKIQALLFLVEHCHRKLDFSGPKGKIKKLFRQAGRIRDAVTQEGQLARLSGQAVSLRDQLSQEIAKESSNLIARIPRHQQNLDRALKQIARRLKDIPDHPIGQFFRRQQKLLTRSLADPDLTKHLHQHRKTIKNLIYAHDILDKNLAKKLALDVPYLHKLEDRIGRWHDGMEVMELLRCANFTDGRTLARLRRQNQRLLHSIQKLAKLFPVRAIQFTIN
jgi:CHAD domain-containing protein